jgi:FKBP-type peptidyl-prolyl cis-trans isomerase FklB
MSKVLPLTALAVVMIAGAAVAEDALDLSDENNRINYSLGHQLGSDFKRQQLDMNPDAVVQGMRDALSGAEPQMTPQEMRETLVGFKKRLAEQQREQRQRNVENELGMLAEGKQFMEENAKKEGVVTTASGLQYQVIEEGSGRSPGPADTVTVDYRGTLVDGTEFDSSAKHGGPATFKLDAVIKGWSEGLQLMKEGGKAKLFIPQELAYGQRGPLAHRALIFDVELISVGEPPAEAGADTAQ